MVTPTGLNPLLVPPVKVITLGVASEVILKIIFLPSTGVPASALKVKLLA
jgi:hypothetical protein